MSGKRAAVDTALIGTRLGGRSVLLVVGGFGRRDGLLDIGGQRKAPCSSRFQNSTRPVVSGLISPRRKCLDGSGGAATALVFFA
jgi:hypothetical protein